MALAPATEQRRRQNAWTPPAALLDAARADRWRGDPQPRLAAQAPVGPGVVWLGRKMRERYPNLITQTYARGRAIPPGQMSSSMHHAGRAIDLMVAEVGGRPDRRADEIANWLLAHAKAIGLQYMIWSGTQWSSATGNASVYPGREDHFNHLHLDFSIRGAEARLPWYAGIDPVLLGGRPRPEETATDAADDEASPPVDMVISLEEAQGIAPGGGTVKKVALFSGVAGAIWAAIEVFKRRK